ncbi:hypothetical protein AB0B25_30180 [Nocardia sp. NPDC049190]|uniref:hypothetical protein n=1 Tax=Nocardia sp. NPDC049190 TaxID=3155650 RepID=UPI0033ED09BB
METEVEAGRLALIEGALFHNELTDDALVIALRAAGLPETARVLNRALRLR